MKIADSNLVLSSQHQLTECYVKTESLLYWQGDRRVEEQNRSPNRTLMNRAIRDRLEISARAKAALRKEQARLAKTEKNAPGQEVAFELSEKDKRKLLILQKFLKALTGKDYDLKVPEEIVVKAPGAAGAIAPQAQAADASPPPQRKGWGLAYDLHETYQEREILNFQAQGVIQTADGKQVAFEVQLNMSREYMVRNDLRIRAGDVELVDPLVINYAGPAADLTETKYEFDLNADGKVEQISFLRAGSGFLTLDLNGDGVANDGRELFGPNAGNGFAELAAYDGDQNDWIDENDAVFERLRVWSKDGEGKDAYLGLKEAGVGAIYLGNTDALFSIKTPGNQLLGQSQKAGVFLKEEGGAGTVQQIDLVV